MTRESSFRILLAAGLLSVAIAVGCSSQPNPGANAPAAPATAVAQEKGGQEETGP
jgi:Spy/CpxP family protein refolding chaperone